MNAFAERWVQSVKRECLDRMIPFGTTSLERAELKRDQISAFGRDWRIPRCEGSMTATIEPAPE